MTKQQLLQKINELEETLDKVYVAGMWGISHVGSANYLERELEAKRKLREAM